MNCLYCAMTRKKSQNVNEKLKFCNLKCCNKRIKNVKGVEIVRIEEKNYIYCSHKCYLDWLTSNDGLSHK